MKVPSVRKSSKRRVIEQIWGVGGSFESVSKRYEETLSKPMNVKEYSVIITN